MIRRKRLKYKNFFSEIQEIQETQKRQKQRGLNDYNIFSSLYKQSNEVDLHSKFLVSLLNPSSQHYQEDFFLQLFIDHLKTKIVNFDFECSLSVKVLREYRDIDIYITNGNQHIIIENKIWAKDQACQIMKYINIVVNENSLDIDDNGVVKDLLVIYLTARTTKIKPDGHELVENKYITYPNTDSLSKCSKEMLASKRIDTSLQNYKVRYVQMNYEHDILFWLNTIHKEVYNLLNLRIIVEQYIELIERLLGQYNSKVNNMKEFLVSSEENLKIAADIYDNYSTIRSKIVKDFFSKHLIEGFQTLLDESDNYKGWSISVDTSKLNEKHSYPIKVYEDVQWKIVFQFGFTKKDMNDGYYGISKYEELTSLSELREKYCPQLLDWKEHSNWSLFWNRTPMRYSNDKKNFIRFKFDTDKVVEEYFNLFTTTMAVLADKGCTLKEINNKLNSI